MSIACTVVLLTNVLQIHSVATKIEAVMEAAATEKNPQAFMVTDEQGFIFPEFTLTGDRRKLISQCMESICSRSLEEVLAASKLADSAFFVKDGRVFGAYFHASYSLIALGVYGIEKTERLQKHVEARIAFSLIEDVTDWKLKPYELFPFSRERAGHLELKPIQLGEPPNCLPSDMTNSIIRLMRLYDKSSGVTSST